MTDHIPSNTRLSFLAKALTVLIVLFAIARFVHLDADFPQGLTWSGELYTDEGWYSNAATNHHLTGKWHIDGDFNPIVNMPVFHLIQAASFSFFGMSLRVTRCMAAFSSMLLFLFIYLFARQYISRAGAALTALLLVSNYIIFAYSRIALLELPMTTLIVLSLLVASSFKGKKDLIIISFSSCILALAVLLKNSAMFAIPILMYVSNLRGTTKRERILYCIYPLLLFSSILIVYNVAASHFYHADYTFFKQMNIDKRMSFDPFDIGNNAINALLTARLLDPILYFLTLGITCVFMISSSAFRKNVLVHISMLWLICYFGLLSITYYHPPRYFLPLLVPIVLLLSTAVMVEYDNLQVRKHFFYLSTIIIFIITISTLRITIYMLDPQYSFINMSNNVRTLIDKNTSQHNKSILLGNFANSISLETGILSINTNGASDLRWRIANYKPNFYVSLGEERDVLAVLSEVYDIEPLNAFNVFHNYSGNRQVWLFSLHPKIDR